MSDLAFLLMAEFWQTAVPMLFISYFILINTCYILLNIFSFFALRSYMDRHSLDHLPHAYMGFDPPISILVPAYNEETTITASIQSMLQLDYPDFEIVVINDGSKDGTLAELIRQFALQPFPEAYRRSAPCKEILGVYRSTHYQNLRVLDKVNGGKADALNAGINAAHSPLLCAVDADSILQRDSLKRVVQPFLEDPRTIVSGGTIRIANGCKVSGGFLLDVGLPKNMLARFQIVEYLRAFLFGRLGFSPMNAVLIVSGAFGLFKKSAITAIGGYRTDTIGEDMELIMRLHRVYRLSGKPYRITYVPDPICWTEAPENLAVLRSQRTRWQRGLAESLVLNRELLFHRRSGAAGWFAFPFFVFFELLGPIIEAVGYLVMIFGSLFGFFSWTAFLIFMFVTFSFGILLSVTALLLEEMSFRLYPEKKQLVILLASSVLENFGYRQINTLWRFQGLMRWMAGKKQQWGEMTRNATLRSETKKI